ncbi:MAG: F0F1 ATP synthase subunit beta, partial [Abditibacteriota bacterium]|nr:F0F1 ATP synthase subunit beta [Abditibacteriota bacterium]
MEEKDLASGKIISVIGPVVDIRFPSDSMPQMLNAVTIDMGGGKTLTVEVEQMIGNDTVRCVAMDSTDGLVRGMEAVDTGASIAVPVGRGTLGRVFNLLGDAIDQAGPVSYEKKHPIHREAPGFQDQLPATELFETGLKVVDLICPYAKGGKIGLFGGAG